MKRTINRRDALQKMAVGLSSLSLLPNLSLRGQAGTKKPNIIFMVADNLGRESVGYYGGSLFKTPHMDAMASEGVVFDNCLIAAPLCAPARCGWNTGRYPFRVGICNKQPDPKDPEAGLSSKEITIAQVLKGAGYDTALSGKWNLGYAEKFNPLHFGFDSYYGSLAGHADYYTHVYNKDMKTHFYRGLTPVNDRGYFDELFTDEAVRYLQSRKGNPKPFYMNLCFYAPHGPFQAPPGYYHSDKPEVNYQHMIEYLDACVGRVLAEVERLGLAENTLIVFLSDQGSSYKNTYGRTLWEDGLKVVCNAVWRGTLPRGKRIETPWLHIDLFAVFAGLAGAWVPADRVVDAKNIWTLFEGREMKHDRTFCWTFNKEDAVRMGDWKLHLTGGKVDGLFDLSTDPDEKHDLSSQHPARVKEMQLLQSKWKTECEAQQTSAIRTVKV